MSETAFFVRPLDVAFFGPPDAQSAGETHYASSLFPPPPRTFQGLVRSRLLAAATPPLDLRDRSVGARQERAALVGESDRLPPGWQIEGPLPAVWNGDHLTPWLPAPLFLRRRALPRPSTGAPVRARLMDLVREDCARGGVAGQSSERLQSENVIGALGCDDAKPLEAWLDASNLRWALTGKGRWAPQGSRELPPMVCREQRVGLAVDPTSRRARDRMLYAVDQLRFDGNGGFLGQLHAELPSGLSAEALTTGTAALGRWNRPAALENVPTLDPAWLELSSGEHLPSEPREDARFWLVCITPWRSDSPRQPSIQGVSGAAAIDVLGALLGRPVTLGGFSMAEHRARPNQLYVPAGSAWLFRVPGVTPARRAEILRALHRSHCLGPREEARMGFGQVLVGIEADE